MSFGPSAKQKTDRSWTKESFVSATASPLIELLRIDNNRFYQKLRIINVTMFKSLKVEVFPVQEKDFQNFDDVSDNIQ